MINIFSRRKKALCNEIIVEYSFKLDCLDASHLLQLLFSRDLGFHVSHLVVGGLEKILVNEEFADKLKKLDSKQTQDLFLKGISIRDENDKEKVAFFAPIPYIIPGVQYLRWIGGIEIIDSKLFLDIMMWPGFVVAYGVSEEDEFIQNQEDIDLYRLRKNLPPISKTVVDESGHKKISIEGNPGRKRIVQNMILRSCWRMWFGEEYFRLVSKQKVEDFKGANINKNLDNDIYFVELYSDPFEASLKSNRLLQKRFNEQIGIEDIYAKCLEEAGLRF